MSAIQHLRAATAADHQAVDAAFARHDLTERNGYIAFLVGHARALPAVERALASADGPPPLRPRAALLAADLAGVGEAMPPPLDLAPPATPAEAWGMAYVIEGSRLGGALLARGVPEGMPHAYLADAHLKGEWRGFTKAFDQALTEPDQIAAALESARRVFALYGSAVTA